MTTLNLETKPVTTYLFDWYDRPQTIMRADTVSFGHGTDKVVTLWREGRLVLMTREFVFRVMHELTDAQAAEFEAEQQARSEAKQLIGDVCVAVSKRIPEPKAAPLEDGYPVGPLA